MCDLLKESALAYKDLSAYEYTLICGKKGVQTQVVIRFPANAYHHLAGFQSFAFGTDSPARWSMHTLPM